MEAEQEGEVIDSSAVWWTVSKSKQMVLFSREIYRIVFIAAVIRRRRLKGGIDDTTQMFLKSEPSLYIS
jgi:hypothetical protein